MLTFDGHEVPRNNESIRIIEKLQVCDGIEQDNDDILLGGWKVVDC